ncbi:MULTISPECIES: phage major tail protein, TP901-1 family [unclassified Sphingomonas]|uniref:phage major tail protein, TP901-1 family n=1 Tax=unclassified Sphingomonas TaxID=196159 RepID=UPI0009262850|nr:MULTISPECIES: phage major tail protein, TP901-1 family [unclassified Sphingomonas]MBN8849467.1 phage major tail protein, TP901-1 family [Sphingomonas sp.]OJV34517.1 MAG: phage major tail protein, TP901-1 family [Sphingomonas sp. 67-36]QKR98739.1 phage major tail protein, TP901-1 family [Sphingomonas sp. CL5.1]
MAVEKGSAFLLKVGDGGSPVAWQTVAGMRTTQMSVSGEAVAITSKDSGGWRELLSGAGVRSVSVSAAGVFTGSAAEARVKANALAGVIDDYRLTFEGGETMTGRFLVTKLEYAGDFNGERSYTLALESSGAVVAA